MSKGGSVAGQHASLGEVEALFLSADEQTAEHLIQHLLDECMVCADASATFWSKKFKPRAKEGSAWSAAESSTSAFDQMFDRLEARVLQAYADLSTEQAEARRHLPRLLQQPLERQLLLVTNSRSFQTWSTCELLLEESWKLRFDDPQQMGAIARVAVEVSKRLAGDRYGWRRTRDLEARCWLGLGNSQRVLGDFTGAEQAIERARELLAEGTGNLLDQANWFDIQASLLNAQRRFREADSSIVLASRIFYTIGQRHALGSALIKRSMISEALDETGRAIVLARAGLDLVDVEREPGVAVGGWLNIVRALHSAGRDRDALSALERARPLYVRLHDLTTMLRFQWMEGRIAQALGREEQAEGCLSEAREGFLKLGVSYETALISLDLAGLLAAQGRYPEVRRLAGDTARLFQVGESRTEALAAIILLRQAAEAERVTSALLSRVASSIRDAHAHG